MIQRQPALAGYSIHIGGLLRLDFEESSLDSIYVTVWASSLLPLHMGRTEKADSIFVQHFGSQMQPPIGEGRVKELGKWVKKEIHVSGNTWDSSSMDVAVSGLGWFSIGLKGEAVLGVWTYDGVDVVVRNALLPQRCKYFEVAGFTVSEIVSKADRTHAKKRKCISTSSSINPSLMASSVSADSTSDHSATVSSSC